MPDEFKPSPPDFNLFVADDEGNIDFQNRSRSGGLWEKEKNGKKYYTGKIGGKRVVMFPVEDRATSEEWHA